MSQPKEIIISKSSVPILAVVILAIIFVFGLFLVGYDQGHLFSIVLGNQAFEDLYIHELTHDMRHAAGFPFIKVI
ncbi:MAG: CbtB domain-containing protein [Nitrosarchaeum sp.]|uniref:CbtB domain-containing protein n=1 Tax=Nitrosarchaeum sp. TaxID=2026886 RepID=UPI002DF35AAA|nr:CbtB domain-containing protein [Nitrosarchaeum sp.]